MTRLHELRARKAAIAAMPYRPTERKATPPANRHHEPCSSSAVSGAIRRGRIYKGYKFRYEAEK